MSDKLEKNNESEKNGSSLEKEDEIVGLAKDVLQALDSAGQDGITETKDDQGVGIHVKEQEAVLRSVEKVDNLPTSAEVTTTGPTKRSATMQMVEPTLGRVGSVQPQAAKGSQDSHGVKDFGEKRVDMASVSAWMEERATEESRDSQEGAKSFFFFEISAK